MPCLGELTNWEQSFWGVLLLGSGVLITKVIDAIIAAFRVKHQIASAESDSLLKQYQEFIGDQEERRNKLEAKVGELQTELDDQRKNHAREINKLYDVNRRCEDRAQRLEVRLSAHEEALRESKIPTPPQIGDSAGHRPLGGSSDGP